MLSVAVATSGAVKVFRKTVWLGVVPSAEFFQMKAALQVAARIDGGGCDGPRQQGENEAYTFQKCGE